MAISANRWAATDAFESVEGSLDLVVFEPAVLCASQDRQGIADLELADQVGVKFETGDFKLGCRGAVTNLERLDCAAFTQAEAFDRAMRDSD